jgi:hypothetical protein
MADEAFYKDMDIVGRARDEIKHQIDILQDMVREYRSGEIPNCLYHIEHMTDMGLRREEIGNMRVMRDNLHDLMTIAANAGRVLEAIAEEAKEGKAQIDDVKYILKDGTVVR